MFRTVLVSGILALCVALNGALAQEAIRALRISTGEDKIPTVEILGDDVDSDTASNHGILVFPPQPGKPESWKSPDGDGEHASRAVIGFTGGSIADSIPAQTVQLEQLLAVTVNRAVPEYSTTTIYSPVDGGKNVNPRPTFRRLPVTDSTGKKSLPIATVRLMRGNDLLTEIVFPEGVESLRWNDLSSLPEEIQNGLPSGDYSLHVAGTTKTARFTVESTELRDWMESRFARIENLLGKDDPVSVQVSAEMLVQDQIDGPFFSDALDRLAALPEDQKTPYLHGLQSFLVLRLTDGQGIVRGGDGRLESDSQEKAEEAKADADPVAASDFIHRLLLNEKWSAAARRLELLETMLGEKTSAENPPSPRDRELIALCFLYRGMIAAEAGLAQFEEGHACFFEAIHLLNEIAAESPEAASVVALSRFRAFNNAGNFLLRRVQDRLYNHALSMASGDGAVLTDILLTWIQSRDVYNQALEIGLGELTAQPELTASTRLNLARLYALLGDVVRTIDQGPIAETIAAEAVSTANRFVGEVLETQLENEERLYGAAHHLAADMAFRQKDWERCRTESNRARECYVRSGTLSGVEAIERLLGMLGPANENRTEKIRHLTIANELAEVLREQIPDETVGLSRAGFLARRAYVGERLIDLLLQEGRTVEALAVLEQSKARTLKDVLSGAGLRNREEESSAVEDLLTDWPKGIAALEYFVGSERSWGFLILDGKVESFPLIDPDDETAGPIPSRNIVGAAVHFLSSCELQAQKMLRQRRGYDAAWESDLYRLRRILLPDVILKRLRDAAPEKLLIVPQHVLHYFPFAALVTEPDKEERVKGAMRMPRFLLDEKFDIFCAPSLLGWRLLRQQDDRPMKRVTAAGISEFKTVESFQSMSPGIGDIKGVKDDMANAVTAFGADRVELLSEATATETALKNRLGARDMFLIATHGINFPQSPLAGFLMLYGDDGNDGVLTAFEIFSLSVGADLVVMSACYSGLADQSPMPGDDLFGLQRAFLYAGARTVVSGTWDVYDKTGPLIVDVFMKNLASGKDVPAAMASAQRSFLAKQREEGDGNPWTHPYFWSVYNITGDDRTCFETK